MDAESSVNDIIIIIMASSPTTTALPPPPSQISMVLDKHLTTFVNCLLNVVHVMVLLHFLDLGMFYPCFLAILVSPVDSWKGLFFNMWFCALVCGLMKAFKNTLECLILFENSQRNKDGKKNEGTTTTTIAVDKACAHIKHVDNGSTNTTTWQTLAGLILHRFLLNQTETKEAETVQNEKDTKEEEEATTTPSSTTTTTSTEDDEIKQQDAASASSSARSTADTSDVLN